MRTLEPLRNSCVDKDSIITFEQSTQSTQLILPRTPMNCSLISRVIESGFYLLSCRILFQFDQSATLFPHDKVYTAIKIFIMSREIVIIVNMSILQTHMLLQILIMFL